MTGLPSMSELFALENPDVLSPRTSGGVPLWSLVRWDVLMAVTRVLYYKDDIRGTESSAGPAAALRQAYELCSGVAHDVRVIHRRPRAEVLVVGDGAVRSLGSEANARNPETDYFRDRFPEMVLVAEDFCGGSRPRPDVLLQRPLRVPATLAGRLSRRPLTVSAVEIALQAARNLFNVRLPPQEQERLRVAERQRARAVHILERTWFALLNALGSRVVLKNACCYGGVESVAIVRAAHRLGAVVAEPQHGMITATHRAYNASPAAVADAAFASTLPDVLLTYGDWWNDQVSLPVPTRTIGHPHRTEAMRHVHLDRPNSSPTDVLVLGDGLDTAHTLTFTRSLARVTARPHRVVFRPHPRERELLIGTADQLAADGVTVDFARDIYQSLRAASIVVAELSTGLYEAVGVAERIVVWDTPKSRALGGPTPFQRAADVKTLAAGVTDPSFGRVPDTVEAALWASDWSNRFDEFLGEALSGRKEAK